MEALAGAPMDPAAVRAQAADAVARVLGLRPSQGSLEDILSGSVVDGS
jgi:hypothetical protein